MKIIFLCQYFPPEMGAPAARTFEHARHWASLGHEVTVITGFPNHPTGVIRPEYQGFFVKRENVEGIELLRTWVYCAANKGFFKRVMNFFSFFFSSLIFGSLYTGKPDVVVGTSPQFFCAVSAYLLSFIKGVPFVLEVRDIWPQSAVELGALKNTMLVRALEVIELHLYRRATLIVAVAESIGLYLISKDISREKIRIIPNGVDERYLASAETTPARVREEIGLKNKFIVSYIGTHGMAHALDVVLQAAESLKSERGVHFLFVGEGAEKEHLKIMAARLKLDNVTFINEQPRPRLLAFYRASDVSIVPLRRLPVFKTALPSKLFELMGTGCPIICSVEGEAAELVSRAEAGICIEPENSRTLIETIKYLRSDEALRGQLSDNGKHFVRTYYLRSALAWKYLDALGSVVKHPERRGSPQQTQDRQKAQSEKERITSV